MRNEDEKLREAARMLSANCEGRRDGCEGCLFCRDNLSCKINGIPVSWDSDFGSVCGKRNSTDSVFENPCKPYCPNCGATMDEGDGNENLS